MLSLLRRMMRGRILHIQVLQGLLSGTVHLNFSVSVMISVWSMFYFQTMQSDMVFIDQIVLKKLYVRRFFKSLYTCHNISRTSSGEI